MAPVPWSPAIGMAVSPATASTGNGSSARGKVKTASWTAGQYSGS